MNTNFFKANRVFIVGLFAAISLAVQQLMLNNSGEIDYKVLCFAILVAIMSYISNEWAGKGVTILGIIGTVAGIFVQISGSEKINWVQFFVMSLLAIVTAILKEPTVVSEETHGFSTTQKKGISHWTANLLK